MNAAWRFSFPQGCERGVASTSVRLLYLRVHRRRRGLMPSLGGQRLEPLAPKENFS
jgi:hypothetical protein